MQVPEQLLADRTIRASAKVVLLMLWGPAEADQQGMVWVGAAVPDIARRGGLALATVKEDLAMLKARGAVRREKRDRAGRTIRGFGLSRAIIPTPPTGRRGSRKRLSGQPVAAEVGRVVTPRGEGAVGVIERVEDFEAVVLTVNGRKHKVAFYQDGAFPRLGGYKLTEETLRPAKGQTLLDALQQHIAKRKR